MAENNSCSGVGFPRLVHCKKKNRKKSKKKVAYKKINTCK